MPSRSPNNSLQQFDPSRGFLVGVDSDGCVMDTMEHKQRACFHPAIISHWKLEPMADVVRQVAEYVNLYSPWRGQNRYVNLLRVMALLRQHPATAGAPCDLPPLTSLAALIASNGSPGLEDIRHAAAHDPAMATVQRWSEDIDERIAQTLPTPAIFPHAAAALRHMASKADVVVISQTPNAALQREWRESGLRRWVRAVTGQEAGSKTRQLSLATHGRYPTHHRLMIGDAPGDAQAAEAADAWFFPICPGHEAASWLTLAHEGFPRFITDRFDTAYAAARLSEFNALLPATPPWEATPNKD